MAFYLYTGGGGGANRVLKDEAYAALAEKHNYSSYAQHAKATADKKIKQLLFQANRSKLIDPQKMKQAVDLYKTELNKYVQDYNIQAMEADRQRLYIDQAIKENRIAPIDAGISYTDGLKKLSSNFKNYNQAQAMYAILQILKGTTMPSLDLKSLEAIAKDPNGDLIQQLKDYLDSSKKVDGRTNIFVRAFRNVQGPIDSNMFRQLIDLVNKYYGDTVKGMTQLIDKNFVNTIDTIIKQLQDLDYKEVGAINAINRAVTVLRDIQNEIQNDSKQYTYNDVTRILTDAAGRYSNIYRQKGIEKLISPRKNNFAVFSGDLGEILAAVKADIVSTTGAAVREYAQSLGPEVAGNLLKSTINSKNIAIQFDIKNLTDAATKELQENEKNILRIVQEGSGNTMQIKYNNNGVKPKPDVFAGTIAELDGEIITLPFYISAKSYRKGTTNAKYENIIYGLDKYIATRFNSSNLKNLTIAGALASKRIMSYLQQVYGSDMIVALENYDKNLNLEVLAALTKYHIDEIMGGTGGVISGNGKLDYTTIFSVNGLAFTTSDIVNHIIKLDAIQLGKNGMIDGQMFADEPTGDITMQKMLGALQYSFHLNMHALYNLGLGA